MQPTKIIIKHLEPLMENQEQIGYISPLIR